MLNCDEVSDAASRQGKLFRRRFRVPHSIYIEILDHAKEWFPNHASSDAVGNHSHPLELKVLAALRVIARGVCFDEVAELTNISEEVLRSFFHKFMSRFRSALQDFWINAPNSTEEVARITQLYERVGFPGVTSCYST